MLNIDKSQTVEGVEVDKGMSRKEIFARLIKYELTK